MGISTKEKKRKLREWIRGIGSEFTVFNMVARDGLSEMVTLET